jgi:hypothetical protein
VADAASPETKPKPTATPLTAVPNRASMLNAKPRSWGHFDAPPVWGHGAKGDTIHKP